MHFVIQSAQAWRDPQQRPHHLARRFAEAGHRVSWIQPRYLGWAFTDAARFVACRRERVEPGIDVAPATLLNGEFLKYVRIFNQDRLKLECESALRKGPKDEKQILWLYNPHEGHLAKKVRHDLLVYDVIDDYTAFPWAPREIEEEENELLGAADWVIAGTKGLYEAKGGRAKGKVDCILSGVEPQAFINARTRDTPKDMRRAKEKCEKLIGYAGVVDHRFDAKLIGGAAQAHPEWGFVLVGPVRTGLTGLGELGSLPNVYMIGAKPYEELPGYYGSWDAALVPFVDDETTRKVNPTKMLEYAAAGLPIVAKGLPELREFYGDGAWLYETEEEFEGALGMILGEGDHATRSEVATKVEAARGWIEGRTWDEIAGRILKEIEARL